VIVAVLIVVVDAVSIQSRLDCIKGSLHLWKDECVFKMGHLCRRNVKLFLNLELSRLRKARQCIFGLCG